MMQGGHVWTRTLTPMPTPGEQQKTLGDVVSSTGAVDSIFFLTEEALEFVRSYLKGAKKEPRRDKVTGFEYLLRGGDGLPGCSRQAVSHYLDRRRWHLCLKVRASGPPIPGGPLRRLVPEELEELNGFPRGWTNTGMTDVKRAFCMGNALIVGIVERIGAEIAVEATSPAR